MKIMRNREKNSSEITAGDVIDVAGKRCTVVETAIMNPWQPLETRVRISLRSDDFLGGPNDADIVLILGYYGIPVKIRK